MKTVYDFQVTTLEGREHSMHDYEGKVLLIVNTASKCGLTPQYAGLEKLYEDKKTKGFEVLGFPCNQFAKQEPYEGAAIGEFCQRNYGVSFPMHEKIDVNGSGAHPLYKHLKSEAKGVLGSESIKWNFTKFLIDRQGRVVRRYGPHDLPETIAGDVEALLREN